MIWLGTYMSLFYLIFSYLFKLINLFIHFFQVYGHPLKMFHFQYCALSLESGLVTHAKERKKERLKKVV